MIEGDMRAAYYCAAEVVRSRKLKGQPVPSWLLDHYRCLDTAIRTSQSGHESDCAAQECAEELRISAREAGEILGRSKRQVQRIASSLGGELVGGRWVFRRSEVEGYREAMDEHATGGTGTGARRTPG